MDNQKPTYDFLYGNYKWPEEGAERNCPFSGRPLALNPKKDGYNGKPWTCTTCMWFFSEEELSNWKGTTGKTHTDCPATLAEKGANPGE